jgi:hypothetical protein
MSIRRRKKKVALLIRPSLLATASGARTAKAGASPASADSVVQDERLSSAGAATKRHSIEWEEEHMTTDLLEDALAGTASALDANRRKQKVALPGLGTSVNSSKPRRGGRTQTRLRSQ